MKVPDIADPEFWQRGPDDEFAELRRGCPVARQPEAGYWVVAGHEEIVAISKDPATYSSAKGVLIGDISARSPAPNRSSMSTRRATLRCGASSTGASPFAGSRS